MDVLLYITPITNIQNGYSQNPNLVYKKALKYSDMLLTEEIETGIRENKNPQEIDIYKDYVIIHEMHCKVLRRYYLCATNMLTKN